MKRTYAAIGILVSIFLLAVFANISVNNKVDSLEEKLALIKTTAADGDFGKVHTLTVEVVNEFSKYEKMLRFFVRREFISGADSSLSGFTSYASKENAADLICEVDKAAAQLDMLRFY